MGGKDLSISQEPVVHKCHSTRETTWNSVTQKTVQLKTFLNKAGFISDTKQKHQ